jgi:hypothetical protein
LDINESELNELLRQQGLGPDGNPLELEEGGVGQNGTGANQNGLENNGIDDTSSTSNSNLNSNDQNEDNDENGSKNEIDEGENKIPADWTLSGNENNGNATLLGFSFTGSTLPAGSGPIAIVHFDHAGGDFTTELCFDDYVLSNPAAEEYFSFAICAEFVNPFEDPMPPIVLEAFGEDQSISLEWTADVQSAWDQPNPNTQDENDGSFSAQETYACQNNLFDVIEELEIDDCSSVLNREEVDVQITGYANGQIEVSMTNSIAVGGFQFDIDAGDDLTELAVSGASGGAAADAGFTVSVSGSGLVLGFSFTGSTIPVGSGVLCYVDV